MKIQLIFLKDFVAEPPISYNPFEIKAWCKGEGVLMEDNTCLIDNVIHLDGKKTFYTSLVLDENFVIPISKYRENQINSILYDEDTKNTNT